jgi:hypothetical protein
LAKHSRFARFDPARRQIVLRGCNGRPAETLAVSARHAAALLE